MHDCPWACTQSISEIHHDACGMRLLSQQSPHTSLEQMYICTCLSSLFIPTTASKDLALRKWAASLLHSLCPCATSSECHGRGLLAAASHMARRAWDAKSGYVITETLALPCGDGFIMIRSLTLMVIHHSYQQTLWYYCLLSFFAHLSHRWASFFVYFNLVLANRSYSGWAHATYAAQIPGSSLLDR